MTVNKARYWLILSSIIITGIQILFLLTAPVFGYPLVYPENLRLLQIITPVFLGYLGSAAHFIFLSPSKGIRTRTQFLGLMIKGPVIVYACALLAAFSSFGYSNRSGAPIGSGMSMDDLATALSIALGVLAVTTSVLSSYLFAVSNKTEQPKSLRSTAISPTVGGQ